MRRASPAKMVELDEDARLAFPVEGFGWATGLGRSGIFKAIGKLDRGEPTGLLAIPALSTPRPKLRMFVIINSKPRYRSQTRRYW
jgi:hypothetical protein